MSRLRAYLVVAGLCTLMVACGALTGCAGMDDYYCGKGYAYRDGYCVGYGDGWSWQSFPARGKR